MSPKVLPYAKVVWLGGLGGLIPFYFSALAIQLGWADELMFQAYSVIILSFLSGVVWWHGLQHADRQSLIVALLIPALAWLFLLLPWVALLVLLASAYVLLWAWEMLRLRPFYSSSYVLLRSLLTLFVVLAHGWVLLL